MSLGQKCGAKQLKHSKWTKREQNDDSNNKNSVIIGLTKVS